MHDHRNFKNVDYRIRLESEEAKGGDDPIARNPSFGMDSANLALFVGGV